MTDTVVGCVMEQIARALADVFTVLSGEHYRRWKFGFAIVTVEAAKPTSVVWKDGEAVPVDSSWEKSDVSASVYNLDPETVQFSWTQGEKVAE
ncbi:MAG: hypothetical protein WC657_07865 [Candidatus Paceibacterota bacterium]|jgi:hypothetical protein